MRQREQRFFKKVFSALVQVTGAALFVCASTLSQQAAGVNPFEQSVQLLEQGKYQEARNEASRVLGEHPNHPFGLNLMGAILDQLRQFDEAEAYYQKALKLDPSSPVFLHNLGSHYLLWGKTALARSFFLRVLKLQPQHFDANYQLGRLALESRDAVEAERFLNQLGTKDRSRPEVALLLARSLFVQKQPARAGQILEQLEQGNRGNPAVAFSAGMVYYEYGLYREAATSFSIAAQLAPDDFEAPYNLGLTHERLGELGAAAPALQRAIQLQAQFGACTLSLGAYLLATK